MGVPCFEYPLFGGFKTKAKAKVFGAPPKRGIAIYEPMAMLDPWADFPCF